MRKSVEKSNAASCDFDGYDTCRGRSAQVAVHVRGSEVRDASSHHVGWSACDSGVFTELSSEQDEEQLMSEDEIDRDILTPLRAVSFSDTTMAKMKKMIRSCSTRDLAYEEQAVSTQN